MQGTVHPGDIVEAHCSRCGIITGHVVMVMDGDSIVRVECRSCGSVHKYAVPRAKRQTREIGPVTVKSGENRRNVAKTAMSEMLKPETSVQKKIQKDAAASDKTSSFADEATWRTLLLQHDTDDPIPYTMSGQYRLHDVILHAKFGRGIVQEILPPDKVRILFSSGTRLLRCGAK
ncbi:MAG: hypothetical protein PUB69_01085 [Desulfovibrionaceae bacterium]|nr:hypothetical protein [Desulfovibrionaceae bacterium]